MTTVIEDLKPAEATRSGSQATYWQLLATWALLSAAIIFSQLPDYLIIVPTLTAAFLAGTRSRRVWLMFVTTGVVLAALLAYSSLFAWSVEYPVSVVG